MKISQNCLDLIKQWEGFKVKAYLDPVGIPTIGFGTIRYPNGQSVEIGDVVSEAEAEAFLKLECDEIAEVVNESVTKSINQNQFDALVSFCYNVGTGAFKGSTLLKKLNQSDFNGAANEFPRWNKATKDGIKVVLPGLTNRRKDEKALFEKQGEEGAPLEKSEASKTDKVSWLEVYRDEDSDDTVIVARKGSEVIEIITIENPHKEELIKVLRQYPNARNVIVAPAGKKIPDGERIVIKERQLDTIKSFDTIESLKGKVPNLNNSLLIIGMGADGDTPESVIDDIENLQRRLFALGYYQGDIDGIFGQNTDRAVKAFQAKYFGENEADGKVGSITWKKLWGQDPSSVVSLPKDNSPAIPGKNYLKLTKTNQKDEYGCFILKMAYYKDGKLKDSLDVCSGAPGRQFFNIGTKSIPRTLEPLPEGKWFMNNIRWAGGISNKDNYWGRTFPVKGNGVGPVTVRLDYKEPNFTRRSAIEIHIDWNRRKGSPGTAGCVGVYSINDYQRFVGWLRETDPRDFYVDWGLGTCPKP